VVGRTLANDEGLVLPPRSRVLYETDEFRFTAEINRLGFRDHEFTVQRVPGAAYVNVEGELTRQRLGFVLEPDTPIDDGPDDSIRLAAGAASLPFVSVTDAFRRHRGARLFPLDGHLTEEGHNLLADRITPAVEGALAAR
jgi:hypothetical protein